ncbi:MAG: cytochrome c maturation protein CcmE [Actinobacteria bacterium]|nr:cytochrome c maturation protein CcmE [Actinomycetota bacterium]
MSFKRARFAIALSLAVVLLAALAYTSLGGNLANFVGPGDLRPGVALQLNGKVVGSLPSDAAGRAQSPEGLRFTVADKKDPSAKVDVVYRGSVGDTFGVGREIIVNGRLVGNTFIADAGSLRTLCPSKFSAKGKVHPKEIPLTPPS